MPLSEKEKKLLEEIIIVLVRAGSDQLVVELALKGGYEVSSDHTGLFKSVEVVEVDGKYFYALKQEGGMRVSVPEDKHHRALIFSLPKKLVRPASHTIPQEVHMQTKEGITYKF